MKMKTEATTYHRMSGLCASVLLLGHATGASAAPTEAQLAGNSLSDYPFFEYVKAFNEDATVEVAIDPTRFPALAGQCDIYVVDAKGTDGWAASTSLVDVTPGGMQTETFGGATIQANTFLVTGPSDLNADAGLGLGVGYDVVLDCDQDGFLGTGDFIDGLHNEAGFYVVHDTTAAGPLAVTELVYALNPAVGTAFGVPATHLGEDLYYPSNIATMGQLPLIIVSHGNGHNYQWYDHIGFHLASYGYIVMSHMNNTVPGVDSASETTLRHTDAFINQVAAGVIAGGALTGHLNADKITWIGHSRGAEGVAIGYDKMFDGTHTPAHYDRQDIRLISSMLPTDFLGTNVANPHDANYHLWTAAGDSDVNGSAGCNQCQTFHLHDRATGHRQSTVVQGAGHGWFHDNDAASDAFTGPCSLGPTDDLTHQIQLGHLLPLVKRYVEDNIPSIDFLTRQYESFRPIGVPAGNPCIVVTHEYRDGSVTGNSILDDYQSQFGTGVSSSGATVTFDVQNLSEDRLDDINSDFSWTATDPFNGATQASSTDSSRGVVFDWTNQNRFYEWEVPVGQRNFAARLLLNDSFYLSLRGAQGTQHPNTLAVLDDLTFSVSLRDGAGTSSTINIGAFGGGLEQPYQRSGGWHNEMETIRIRVTDFLNNGSGLNLGDIVAVRLDVGPSWGSAEGRMVIDDVMLTNDRAVYDGSNNGEPHITTVNGIHYDFQSAGEFVALRMGTDLQIHTRQAPVSTAAPITNAHTGLASCVSVNTAVAARVGDRRVTYQPNLDGSPNPNGLQLRIDGVPTTLDDQGFDLGNGGRVAKSSIGNGIEIGFPDGTVMVATSNWWSSQSLWYINLSVLNTPATEGIMGLIAPGDWLPALPDTHSMGPRPATLHQRHIDLNQTFADAWRVSDASSLFDYQPRTSTATFTDRGWPPEKPPCVVPESPAVKPVDPRIALRVCTKVRNEEKHADCVFDVTLTGERGFAKAYLVSERIEAGTTRTFVFSDKRKSRPGEAVTFTARVARAATKDRTWNDRGQPDSTQDRKDQEQVERPRDRHASPAGYVQFLLDGSKVGKPVELNANGQAAWTPPRLPAGKHKVAAIYLPLEKGGVHLSSRSLDLDHAVHERDYADR